MLKVLHVGLGPLGQRIVKDLYDRKVGKVVEAVDINPDLTGKPLSKAVAGVKSSTKIKSSLNDISNWGGFDVAIVTTASDLRNCADTFRTILKAGVPIVSTCEELVWPWLRHKKLANELDTIAQRSQSMLLGTGVNPGFLMDAAAVFATTPCKSVDSMEIHRIQDATTRRIPFQKKIGATLDDAAFKAGIKAGWLRHVGLGESLFFVANAMGWKIDSWSETIEPVKATKTMSCGLGPIKKGNACGVRQVAIGKSKGKTVLKFVFQAAIGQKDPAPGDRVIVTGEPKISMAFEGGVHGDIATSSITINSIKPLLSAKPGLHTMATIPLVHFTRGK
ncbi:MAG: hypothetical protein IBJ18_00670 [Phycisphaerales bacterium]|nr:hypothetical protein [Phycisphaerales bacterium]